MGEEVHLFQHGAFPGAWTFPFLKYSQIKIFFPFNVYSVYAGDFMWMQETLLDILLKLLTLGHTDLIYDGQNRACEGRLHTLYYASLCAARITNREKLLSCKAAVENGL